MHFPMGLASTKECHLIVKLRYLKPALAHWIGQHTPYSSGIRVICDVGLLEVYHVAEPQRNGMVEQGGIALPHGKPCNHVVQMDESLA